VNLLDKRIKEVLGKGEKLLSCLLPLGDPNLKTSRKLVEVYMKAGVDIIELGMPSVDPYCDSVFIADSNRRSLNNQPKLEKYFETIKAIRKDHPHEPFEVMAYSDTLLSYGAQRFIESLNEAGINAHLLADSTAIYPKLVPEVDKHLMKYPIHRIRFMPHPFQEKLLEDIGKNAQAFMILQSHADPQGKREKVAAVNRELIAKLRATKTRAAILLAYGINNGKRAKEAVKLEPDGVLVGSVMVTTINSGNFTALADLIKEIKAGTFG